MLPRLVTSRKDLGIIYEALGNVVFRHQFQGRMVRWSYVDVGYVWEIFQQRCYTQPVGMEIGEHDTVIDAGANVGVFTVLAAVNAPHGRVIAIEPKVQHFLKLLRNIEANELPNVTPVNAALASYDDVATLWQEKYGSGSDSLIQGDSTRGESVQVISPLTLMARYKLDHVDFLKLDIEGAEYDLFSGDLSWLDRVTRLAAEAHRKFGNPELIVNCLTSAGFQVHAEPVKRPSEGDLQIYAIKAGEVDHAFRPGTW